MLLLLQSFSFARFASERRKLGDHSGKFDLANSPRVSLHKALRRGGNDGKQQVFLDPYRIYIDYADSDLSYDEMTEYGIKGRGKGRKERVPGSRLFFWPKIVIFPLRHMMYTVQKTLP